MTSTAAPVGAVGAVGIDVCPVADVAAAVHRHPVRYPRLLLSESERRGGTPTAPRIAMAFAVKEAVAKTLAPDPGVPWPWTSIEVELDGPPRVRLTGPAADLAAARGIAEVAVSVALTTSPGRHGGAGDHTPPQVAVATAIAVRGEAIDERQ